MTDRQIAELFKLRQTAQDKFYEITGNKPFIELSRIDQTNAMYNKGREEGISEALFILDLV